MYQRISKPLLTQSFFLFGARGTGKSSLIRQLLPPSHQTFWVDLLDDALYRELLVRPQGFVERIPAHFHGKDFWVIADEIQRLPSLLNYCHKLIEERKISFALTGSSARKLKREGANLLSGRAFVNELHPLTQRELGNDFDLSGVLRWGSLPQCVNYKTTVEKSEYLKAYVSQYIRQEIKEEQIVRSIDPFVRFLEVAAQMNGKVVNASKIGRHSMTDSAAVLRYFEILVDTLLGFYLEPYHQSVRKVQTAKAKFYFFDLGVKKAIEGTLNVPLVERTFSFGDAFEHFFILECHRLRDYTRAEDRFYYLRTKDGLEIDLLVERSRKELWGIEIKSNDRVDETEILKLKNLAQDLGLKKLLVASREKTKRVLDAKIEIWPWLDVLEELYPG